MIIESFRIKITFKNPDQTDWKDPLVKKVVICIKGGNIYIYYITTCFA